MKWIKHKPNSSKLPQHDLYDDDEVQMGYVDPVYTCRGRKKYIACFSPFSVNDENQEYFFSVKEGKKYVEEKYLLYQLTGNKIVSDEDDEGTG